MAYYLDSVNFDLERFSFPEDHLDEIDRDRKIQKPLNLGGGEFNVEDYLQEMFKIYGV